MVAVCSDFQTLRMEDHVRPDIELHIDQRLRYNPKFDKNLREAARREVPENSDRVHEALILGKTQWLTHRFSRSSVSWRTLRAYLMLIVDEMRLKVFFRLCLKSDRILQKIWYRRYLPTRWREIVQKVLHRLLCSTIHRRASWCSCRWRSVSCRFDEARAFEYILPHMSR